MYTRREFGKTALAALALSSLGERGLSASVGQQGPQSIVRGVKLGIITGSLGALPEEPGRDPIDVMIEVIREVGTTNIELTNVMGLPPAPSVVGGGSFGQPPATITADYLRSRQAMREYRIALPLERFRVVRQKFADAGLNLFSYVYTIGDDFSDTEIEAAYKQMDALGVKLFTTNRSRVSAGPRIAELSEHFGISPSWHPHDDVHDTNEVATPESMEKLLAMSPRFMINLDIGHYTAGNNDSVAFIREHHDRISHLHVKDRRMNRGPNVALGTGDTPIREVLTTIRDNQWPIMAILERQFLPEGSTGVQETKAQLAYMRQVLES